MSAESYGPEELQEKLDDMKKLNGVSFKLGRLKILPLIIKCSDCSEELELHGNEIYYNDCLNIKGMGLCHECRLVHEIDVRYYSDGRIMHYDSEKGWVVHTPRHKKKNLYEKIKEKFARTFK